MAPQYYFILSEMKNIKNIKLPPITKEDSFGFLKQGTDK